MNEEELYNPFNSEEEEDNERYDDGAIGLSKEDFSESTKRRIKEMKLESMRKQYNDNLFYCQPLSEEEKSKSEQYQENYNEKYKLFSEAKKYLQDNY
jgi:hypothetical protein